jgi:hypothetical protein
MVQKGDQGPQGAQGVGQGFTFRNQWSPLTTYNSYDVLTYQGQTYFVINGFTSGTTFDSSNLALWAAQGPKGDKGDVGQGFVFKGAWNTTDTYKPYDVVSYNGVGWVAQVENTNVIPVAGETWVGIAPPGPKGDKGDQGIQGPIGPVWDVTSGYKTAVTGETSLVSYFRFEEAVTQFNNSVTIADSKGSYPLRWGGYSYNPSGYAVSMASRYGLGRGIQFPSASSAFYSSGNNSYAIPINSLYEYSIELWFNVSATNGGYNPYDDNAFHLLDVGRIASTYFTSITIYNGGKVAGGAKDDSYYGRWVSSTKDYNDGQWHHVVLTVTDNNSISQYRVLTLYVDGVQVATGNTSGRYFCSTSSGMVIGFPMTQATNSSASNSVYQYPGALDELSFYNKPLTAAQVSAHYSSAFPYVQQMNFRGVYSATATYAKNDIVTFGGSTYMAAVDAVTSSTPSGTNSNWLVVATQGTKGDKGDKGDQGIQGIQGLQGQGYSWKGNWSNLTSYIAYDCVQYNGTSYVCTQANSAMQPDTGTQYWGLFAAQGAKGDKGDQGIQGPPGSSGAAPSRSDMYCGISGVTPTTRATTTVHLGKSFELLKVTTNAKCRVELYSTAEAAAADEARPVGAAPTGMHGVIADLALDTPEQFVWRMCPSAVGSDLADTPTGDITCVVTNTGTQSQDYQITFTVLTQEQ